MLMSVLRVLRPRGMVEMLNKFKVSSLQGYYFSKPIPFDEFMAKDFE